MNYRKHSIKLCFIVPFQFCLRKSLNYIAKMMREAQAHTLGLRGTRKPTQAPT